MSPERARDAGSRPATVGRYELLDRIASGGMAVIYRGRALGPFEFSRDVAIKVLHPHLAKQSTFVDELIEEARVAASIHHANVVPVLDIGQADGAIYLVLEYVDGCTMGRLRAAARDATELLPWSISLRVLLDALAGLHAAHELRLGDGRPAGLVHRDFTPQNILIGRDGVARLSDFGIARTAARERWTRTGVVKGKVAYMAPEQARGHAMDRRVDVWAAGVVAWEIFARRRMFDASHNEASLLRRIGAGDVDDLAAAAPDLPVQITRAVGTALTADAKGRCPTAAAFSAALLSACEQAGIDVASHDEVAAMVRRFFDREPGGLRSAVPPQANVEPPPEAPSATTTVAERAPTRREGPTRTASTQRGGRATLRLRLAAFATLGSACILIGLIAGQGLARLDDDPVTPAAVDAPPGVSEPENEAPPPQEPPPASTEPAPPPASAVAPPRPTSSARPRERPKPGQPAPSSKPDPTDPSDGLVDNPYRRK